MGKTLLEAAKYLRTSENRELQADLLENGRQMIGQICSELKRYGSDLYSSIPLELIRCIDGLGNKTGKSEELEDTLRKFIQILPNEIKYQVRAVFFAELGEKWDSMESVYQFMRNDPRFDPVVVLTPIYRVVNQNGTQRKEVIYKDYLTSLGVPFLDYDKYSLTEDYPDLAFISKPYERCTPK